MVRFNSGSVKLTCIIINDSFGQWHQLLTYVCTILMDTMYSFWDNILNVQTAASLICYIDLEITRKLQLHRQSNTFISCLQQRQRTKPFQDHRFLWVCFTKVSCLALPVRTAYFRLAEMRHYFFCHGQGNLQLLVNQQPLTQQ